MKKTLIALAAVAVSGAAFAQVTITGAVAWGVQNTVGDQAARFNLTNADVTFASSEDLGGGLKAGASATLTFENERSNATTVEAVSASIGGGFGTFAYASVLSGSAKMSAGVSVEDDMTDAIGAYAAVNVITYTTPELAPGLTATVELAGAQGKADTATKNLAGTTVLTSAAFDADGQLKVATDPTLIVNYKSGPLTVYFDYPTKAKDWDARVTYDLGVAKVGYRATSADQATLGATTEFTVTAPMGAVNVGYHYAKSDVGSANGFAVSYALSKRSAISASYVNAKKGAAGLDGNNYRVQVSHSF